MADQRERPLVAVQGPGRASAVGVHAPIGAVSRKDRTRAARTVLRRDGPSALVLTTALPGTVKLQRRVPGDAWDTVEKLPTSRNGQTRFALPQDAGSPATYRVVFAPKNEDITTWVSDDLIG